jgi:TfoX/Sxy family transcriptional regulator of competence genes
MAYDPELVDRIRELIGDEPGVAEKRLFGGVAFLVEGNMSVAASRTGGLLVRCEAVATDDLLAEPYASPMVTAGSRKRGWVFVAAEGVESEEALSLWVERGFNLACSLPPKL